MLASQSFITSVVVGKDIVPRIGLHQLEMLRHQLVETLHGSNTAKVSWWAGESLVKMILLSTHRTIYTFTQTFKPSNSAYSEQFKVLMKLVKRRSVIISPTQHSEGLSCTASPHLQYSDLDWILVKSHSAECGALNFPRRLNL